MMTPAFLTLADADRWYEHWLRAAALPCWSAQGRDPVSGLFREALTPEGAPQLAPVRARVQTRQTFVYAACAHAGLAPDGLAVARQGFDLLLRRYRRDDGLFLRLLDSDGGALDATAALYDQAFALLAMAALHQADPGDRRALDEVQATRRALEALRHPAGGFREVGDHPFQANAQMHLLEAALAWEAAGQEDWSPLVDEIVQLALDRFIDRQGGFLREFFDAAWAPAAGDDGRLVEPGHQFEWAWLLERWGRLRQDARAQGAARALFASGIRGVDPDRGVAINLLDDSFAVRDRTARLWPQTEYLKAALILGEERHALIAANGLRRYLDTPAPGVWRDRMLADGAFIEEPAPASSFYHIVVALLELRQACMA